CTPSSPARSARALLRRTAPVSASAASSRKESALRAFPQSFPSAAGNAADEYPLPRPPASSRSSDACDLVLRHPLRGLAQPAARSHAAPRYGAPRDLPLPANSQTHALALRTRLPFSDRAFRARDAPMQRRPVQGTGLLLRSR